MMLNPVCIKKGILLITFAASLFNSQAQESFDFFSLESSFTKTSHIDFSPYQSLDKTQFSFSEFHLTVNYEQEATNNLSFLGTIDLDFKRVGIGFNNKEEEIMLRGELPNYLLDLPDLTTLYFTAGPAYRLTDKWTLAALFGMALSTNSFSSIVGDDFYYDITLLAHKQVSKKKALGLGMYGYFFNKRSFYVPIAYGYFKKKKFEFEGLIPLSLDIRYHFNNKHSVESSFLLDLRDFNFKDGNSDKENYSNASSIEYSGYQWNLMYNYIYRKHWRFSLGTTLAYRQLHFLTNESPYELNLKFNPGIRFGLSYIVF